MAAFLPAIISAAGSIGGGYLAGRGGQPQESKLERTRRHLIDRLLGSLSGGGEFSHLFETSDEDFQKSVTDPLKSIFNNQIAPQIQQQYIAGGQQRGTGLDDQMLRAGVDLDQLLNKEFINYKNSGKDRMTQILMGILGGGSGAPAGTSGGQDFMSAAGGYLTSKGFSNSVGNMFNSDSDSGSSASSPAPMGGVQMANRGIPPRKGYLNDDFNNGGGYGWA